jgi:hypothetical protein
MGWAFCGTDDSGREIGYGVVATCDSPGCEAVIDRGLGYVCGPMHLSSEWGCAKYFCEKHRYDHGCEYPEPEDNSEA